MANSKLNMEFKNLPLIIRVTLPISTFMAVLLEFIFISTDNKASMAEGLIMVILFYFSWTKIIGKNTSEKNKKKIIISTYLFSFLIIILFSITYIFSGLL